MRRTWLGIVTLPALAALVLTTSPGCPPRETRIEIAAAGAGVLVNACEDIDVATLCDGITTACAGRDIPECNLATAECDRLTTQTRCTADTLRAPEIQERSAVGVRLALVAPDASIRAATDCTTAIFACGGALTTDCVADALNATLSRVMPDGLGYDGLDEPSEVTPVLLLYADPEKDGHDCAADTLFACGALGERAASAESYDVVCGSCQGGPRLPFDSGICGDCFLPACVDYAIALETYALGK